MYPGIKVVPIFSLCHDPCHKIEPVGATDLGHCRPRDWGIFLNENYGCAIKAHSHFNLNNKVMKKLLCGLLVLGLTIPSFAQVIKTEELSEVVVYATNYKYLNNVDTQEEASIPVEMLRRKVAAFDVKESEFYQDDYDVYNINFFIPEGKILAAYDKDGKIIRTAERFKNINLPKAVKEAVLDRFPEWTITKDIYLVNYHTDKGVNKKYKLKLENGEKVLRVKVDETGEFL